METMRCYSKILKLKEHFKCNRYPERAAILVVSKVLDPNCFRFLSANCRLFSLSISDCPRSCVPSVEEVNAKANYDKLLHKQEQDSLKNGGGLWQTAAWNDFALRAPQYPRRDATQHDQIKLKLWRNDTKCGTATRQRNARELRGARTIKVCRAIPSWCYSK